MTRARLIGIAAAVVLAGLAFQAGEYGMLEWLKLRSQLAEELGDTAYYPGRQLYGL